MTIKEEKSKLIEERDEINKKILELHSVYSAKLNKLAKRKDKINMKLKAMETCEPCNPNNFNFYKKGNDK